MPVKLVIMVQHHTMRQMQALHTPGVTHDHFVQAKLAKLRRELLEPGSGSGAGGGGKGEGFDVNKVGDARVGLVGTLPLPLKTVTLFFSARGGLHGVSHQLLSWLDAVAEHRAFPQSLNKLARLPAICGWQLYPW